MAVQPKPAKIQQRSNRRIVVATMAAFLLAILAYFAPPYVHACRLLTSLQRGATSGVATRDVPGSIKMREYLTQSTNAPVLVLVHGVHYLGIEEPRLKAFAQGMAHEGVRVFTPELPGASHYRITPSDIDVIGNAALEAKRISGAKRVCVLGLSFSGGLALLTAADPRYADSIQCVVAVGAHASMQRVAFFFGTNREQLTNGGSIEFPAHDYGQLVMVYAHPEDYLPAHDTESVRTVLAFYLHGDVKRAREELSNVSSASRFQLQEWISGHRDGLGPELVSTIPHRASEMQAISPAGHLQNLHARVMLLHGAGDNVIPPSETEFLAREVPHQDLVEELVSPAISHVEVSKPKFADKVRLIRWMAHMFRELDAAH